MLRSSFKNINRICFSTWSHVEAAPPDPILGLTEAFLKDDHPDKVLLGAGAYRDDNGKPWVLPAIKIAEDIVTNQHSEDYEYAPITGLPSFTRVAKEILFGDSIPENQHVFTTQSISGTGALRLGAEFFRRFKPGASLYVSTPTWGNHNQIFNHAGVGVEHYRYYNKSDNTIDMDGLTSDITAAPSGSIFLLQTCAHNPTGLDPTVEQWNKISEVLADRKQYCFFDAAYQGFASGHPEKDGDTLRRFVKSGDHGDRICASQSFAKSAGLYGERIGAFHMLANSKEDHDVIASNMKIIIRGSYSSPPIHGARLVTALYDEPAAKAQWDKDLLEMAGRIISMREQLVEKLAQAGSTKDWSHITRQIGMFCFSGLSEAQVIQMRDQFHIFFTTNGRISMCGVTSKNIDYLAKGMHEVTK